MLFLNANGTVKSHTILSAPVPGAADADFGLDVAKVGDVNGDGVVDVAISDGAQIWILFLNTSGGASGGQSSSSAAGGFPDLSLDGAFRNLGVALDALGDFDGDGVPDLLMTTIHGSFETSYGRAWIVHLNADGRPDLFLGAPTTGGIVDCYYLTVNLGIGAAWLLQSY